MLIVVFFSSLLLETSNARENYSPQSSGQGDRGNSPVETSGSRGCPIALGKIVLVQPQGQVPLSITQDSDLIFKIIPQNREQVKINLIDTSNNIIVFEQELIVSQTKQLIINPQIPSGKYILNAGILCPGYRASKGNLMSVGLNVL